MPAGYVNIWSAGQDALLNALAQRDAARQLDEEKARQARLDEENRQDRAALRAYQQKQFESLDEDRDERRRLAAETAKAKTADTEEKGARERLRQDAIYAYSHAKTPEEKARAREVLELQFEMKFQAPAEKKPEWISDVDPKTGKERKTYRVAKEGETITPYRAPRAEPRGDPRERDDPTFPSGPKAWVDNMIALGNPLEDTVSTIVRGWPQQRQYNPRADLGKAIEYVKKFYTGPYNDPIMKKPAAGGGGPGAGSAAVQAPSPPTSPPAAPPSPATPSSAGPPPSGTRPQSIGPFAGTSRPAAAPPASPPPVVTPTAGGPPPAAPPQFSDAEMREAAIAVLTEGKAEVNEQNIATVMANIRRRLAGGK